MGNVREEDPELPEDVAEQAPDIGFRLDSSDADSAGEMAIGHSGDGEDR